MGNDFFSISGDGATDVAKLSQETGSLRLLDTKTMLPKDVFLSFEQLNSEDAAGVFNTFLKMLRAYHLSEEELLKKMI